jgi:hypothetical protein
LLHIFEDSVLLDIPDNGAYYVWDGASPGELLTEAHITKFIAGYKHGQTRTRLQLS